MGYVKIWIHAVWTIKNRKNYLNDDIRYNIFKHIKSYAEEKGIYIDFINGYLDHVHCLLSLNADQNIADVMHLIKGESSFWVNKNGLTEERFTWQNDYYAASISKSHLERVRNYIRNQEIHHSSQALDDEVDELFSDSPHQRHMPELKFGETDGKEQ